MKTTRFLAGAALITALTMANRSTSQAAVATVDLGGVVIASGSNVSRDSGTTSLGAASSYTYSLTGTVSGTGLFSLLPTQSIASFLDTLSPGSSAQLSGTFPNPGGTLPVAVLFSETFSGSFLSGLYTGAMTFSGAIDANGKVSIQVTNVSFSPNVGSLVIDSGKVEVNDGGVWQPDGILASGTTKVVGEDVYSPTSQKLAQSVKTSKTKTLIYTVQNDGSDTDSFTIKGKKGKLGFKVKYFDGLTDVTSAVVGGTFQTGPVSVGASVILNVNVTNSSALPGTTLNIAIEATSDSDPSDADKVTISAKAK